MCASELLKTLLRTLGDSLQVEKSDHMTGVMESRQSGERRNLLICPIRTLATNENKEEIRYKHLVFEHGLLSYIDLRTGYGGRLLPISAKVQRFSRRH